MQKSAAHHFLQLLGGLCATAGFLTWIRLAWNAFSDLESVTAHGDEGGRLMAWALTGTLLMIVGLIILHVSADVAEREEQTKRTPPR